MQQCYHQADIFAGGLPITVVESSTEMVNVDWGMKKSAGRELATVKQKISTKCRSAFMEVREDQK